MKMVIKIGFGLFFLLTATRIVAEIIVYKTWKPVKGNFISGNNQEIIIIEEDSKKEIRIKLKDVNYIIEESFLEPDTVRDYKIIDWKNYEFWKTRKKEKVIIPDVMKRDVRVAMNELLELQGPSFSELYSPRIGLKGGYSMSIGKVGASLKPGPDAMIFNDYMIPVSFINLRTGIMAGYAAYTSKTTALNSELTLVPLIAYGEISFLTGIGFVPYIRLGSGVTWTTLSDNSDNIVKHDTSSIDVTMLIGGGAGYIFNRLPYLEFIIDLSYMGIFEKVSGNFLNLSFGVAYHFRTGGEYHDDTKVESN